MSSEAGAKLCEQCGKEPAADLNLSDAELQEIHADLLNRMRKQKPESFWQKLRRRIKKLGNAE